MMVAAYQVASRILMEARHASRILFSRRYLLATNVLISASLSATGDILEQHYEIVTKHQKPWDTRRTLHMSASGITVGILCHYWYIFLDKRLPGRSLRIVMKKVIIDQIVLSPLAISLFFVTVGTLEKSKPKDIGKEIIEKGHQLYLAEWFIWPVAQYINFAILPTRFRVLYDNTISLGFDVYTSHVKHKEKPPSKTHYEENRTENLTDLNESI